jgi:hypothetical protein
MSYLGKTIQKLIEEKYKPDSAKAIIKAITDIEADDNLILDATTIMDMAVKNLMGDPTTSNKLEAKAPGAVPLGLPIIIFG